ncbi:hypothetical protein H4P1_00026 (plasmid) [Variovorax sp. PBS-H4]|uniref:hypothetical protein n=1 Tax=Variovorax sp. PBS-H4 TaxID=434008 RepID=UPI001317F545|nr:hypothetical protein [Variovorax sp. PBS-H4]VTU41394.1 hypothetical protein H4P1_00026 [Variovorax sp. PBS-H4]
MTQTVSALANFDVSKRGLSAADNTGPLYATNRPCSFDATRSCTQYEYPLTLSSPDAAKGTSPLASPFTLVDDISPATYFGATVWADAIAQAGSEAAALAKYAPRYNCSGVQNLWGSLPWSSGGNSTVKNAVRNSGTIDCTQPGGVGTPVQISFANADTTGYTVPTLSGNNSALPADSGYIISVQVNLEIPLDAILDLGEESPNGNSWTLQTENTYTDIVANDIAGNPNAGEVLANQQPQGPIALQRGEGFVKWFSAPWGAPNNTPAGTFNGGFGAWQGPPGSSYVREGNTVVIPRPAGAEQPVLLPHRRIPNSGTQFSRSYFGCDVWDDTQLGLTLLNNVGSANGETSRPSNGQAAWISLFFNGVSDAAPLSDLRNLKIEYSSGPAGPGADADCTTGTWYSTPDAVPEPS